MSHEKTEEDQVTQHYLTRVEQVLPDQRGDSRDEAWQRTLVARYLAGDEQAFALLAETYGGLLLRTAFLLVHDEEAAKDIVQESLLLAWKNLGKLRDPGALRPWLLKIVVNQSITLKRQWVRKAKLLREQIAHNYTEYVFQLSDAQRGSLEDMLDVSQAIERLPTNQRVVLLLFYYHRLTMPEIADMLGEAENTLRKRLQLALAKIRRNLGINPGMARGAALTNEPVGSHITIHGGGA